MLVISIHQPQQQGLGFLLGGEDLFQLRLGGFQPGLHVLLRRLVFGDQILDLKAAIFVQLPAWPPNRAFALRHCD